MREMDNQSRFNSYCKVLAGIVSLSTSAEVDICKSHRTDALVNVLVIDSSKTQVVATAIKKINKLRIIEKIEYPSTEPNETASTLLVYAEVA